MQSQNPDSSSSTQEVLRVTCPQVEIRACTGDVNTPVIVDVNYLQQQIYVYGFMRWAGNIKFINSYPSPRRAGLFPLISILSVEEDGIVEFEVRRTRGVCAQVVAAKGGGGAGRWCSHGCSLLEAVLLSYCPRSNWKPCRTQLCMHWTERITMCYVCSCCLGCFTLRLDHMLQDLEIEGTETCALFEPSNAWWSAYSNDTLSKLFVPQPSDYDRLSANEVLLLNWKFNKSAWVRATQVSQQLSAAAIFAHSEQVLLACFQWHVTVSCNRTA